MLYLFCAVVHKIEERFKKKFKIGSFNLFVLALIFITVVSVKADEFSNVGSLYDKAVSENIIDPNLYTKVNWEKDEFSTPIFTL